MKKYLIPALAIFVIITSFNSCSLIPFLPPSVGHFRDNSNFKWSTDTSKHFQFYFEEGSWAAKNSMHMKIISEDALSRCLKIMDITHYKETMFYFTVKDRRGMKLLTGIEPNACTYTTNQIICAITNDSLKAIGNHEIFHILTWNNWGSPSGHWVSEGYAVFADDNWHGMDLHILAKYIHQKGKWISLKELASNFNSYDGLISEPEAGSFIKFIFEKYGHEKAQKFWDEGISASEEFLGISIESLEKDWLNEIQKVEIKNIEYPI